MSATFLLRPPHPEDPAARCTTDSGVPIQPAVDMDVLSCCAWKDVTGYQLFVVPENAPANIVVFSSTTGKTFSPNGTFFTCSAPIKSINTLVQNQEYFIFVTADRGYLLNQRGNCVKDFSLPARYATAFFDEDHNLRLICDGHLCREENGRFVPEARLEAIPYRMAGTERYDALYAAAVSIPGNIGGNMLYHNGKYLYVCAQRFNRCARENIDTFLCIGEKADGQMSRRFLLLPNSAGTSLFADNEGNLFAAFIGSTEYSAIHKKPAIVALEWQNIGFYRAQAGLVFENSPVDVLKPSDNGNVDIRDPFVYPAPDGWYYMTGTTAREHGTFWSDTNGICLWRSKNLRTWEFVSKVFDYQENPNSWQKNISTNCWAPEICFHDGTYWITYSLEPGCGLLKSTSGKPEGPYTDMGRVVMRGIDSSFFYDDDHTLYLIWQNGRIAPFTSNMRSFAREPRLLLQENGQQVGYEGAGLIKVRDKYVLYAAEWNGDMRIDGTYDMMYAVSDSLYGPYSSRKLLVPHGGHGCLFYDKSGTLRFTMFGNDRTAPFSRKAGIGYIDIQMNGEDLTLLPVASVDS